MECGMENTNFMMILPQIGNQLNNNNQLNRTDGITNSHMHTCTQQQQFLSMEMAKNANINSN